MTGLGTGGPPLAVIQSLQPRDGPGHSTSDRGRCRLTPCWQIRAVALNPPDDKWQRRERWASCPQERRRVRASAMARSDFAGLARQEFEP